MNDATNAATMSMGELQAAIERLSRAERVALADMIVQSLEPEDAELVGQWVEEVEERIAAVRRGELELVDADEVFAKLRKR